MGKIKELIAMLLPRHSEKVRRRKIALSVSKGQDYATIAEEVENLNAQIDHEVQQFISEAEQAYKEKHKS